MCERIAIKVSDVHLIVFYVTFCRHIYIYMCERIAMEVSDVHLIVFDVTVCRHIYDICVSV